jgi:hypothetical protein
MKEFKRKRSLSICSLEDFRWGVCWACLLVNQLHRVSGIDDFIFSFYVSDQPTCSPSLSSLLSLLQSLLKVAFTISSNIMTSNHFFLMGDKLSIIAHSESTTTPTPNMPWGACLWRPHSWVIPVIKLKSLPIFLRTSRCTPPFLLFPCSPLSCMSSISISIFGINCYVLM